MGLLGFKRYKAKMFNERGEHIKDVFFGNFDDTFKYKKKAYNVKHQEGSYFDSKGVLFDTRYYIYNISNPDPLKIEKTVKPVMNPETYNIMLETSVAKQLNNAHKGGLPALLSDPKYLIGGLILLVVGYLVMSGKLTEIIQP